MCTTKYIEPNKYKPSTFLFNCETKVIGETRLGWNCSLVSSTQVPSALYMFNFACVAYICLSCRRDDVLRIGHHDCTHAHSMIYHRTVGAQRQHVAHFFIGIWGNRMTHKKNIHQTNKHTKEIQHQQHLCCVRR